MFSTGKKIQIYSLRFNVCRWMLLPVLFSDSLPTIIVCALRVAADDCQSTMLEANETLTPSSLPLNNDIIWKFPIFIHIFHWPPAQTSFQFTWTHWRNFHSTQFINLVSHVNMFYTQYPQLSINQIFWRVQPRDGIAFFAQVSFSRFILRASRVAAIVDGGLRWAAPSTVQYFLSNSFI